MEWMVGWTGARTEFTAWLDLAVVRTPHNLTEPLVQRTGYSILKVPDNLKHESVEFDLPRPVFPFSPFRQKGGKRERGEAGI